LALIIVCNYQMMTRTLVIANESRVCGAVNFESKFLSVGNITYIHFAYQISTA